MSEPLVSCITPTYGRSHLLQEMYWCWSNQSYLNKELIIVNDQPNLIIKCDNPFVKIFNFQERFVGLGAKRNYCIEQTDPDTKYILPFDDDDLFLPDHITTLVNGFLENQNCHRTKNYRHFIIRNNEYDGIMEGNQPFFGASCFDAKVMKSIKFNESYIMGEDVTWMDNNGIITHTINYPVPTFGYRLGMGIVHASGHHIDINDPAHQQMLYDKIGNSILRLDDITEINLKPKLSHFTQKIYNELLMKVGSNV